MNDPVYAAAILKNKNSQTKQSSSSMSTEVRTVITVFLPCFEYNKHKMASSWMYSPTPMA